MRFKRIFILILIVTMISLSANATTYIPDGSSNAKAYAIRGTISGAGEDTPYDPDSVEWFNWDGRRAGEYTSAEYGNLQNSSKNAWSTTIGTDDADTWTNLLYNFTLNESIGDITQLDFEWVGYDQLDDGGNFDLWVWNYTSSSYVLIDRETVPKANDETYTFQVTSDFSDFISDSVISFAVSGDLVVSGGSCPFIYSWDGNKYTFDHEAFPFSVMEMAQEFSPSIGVLRNLKSIDGVAKIKILEKLPETSYIDKVEMHYVEVPDDHLIMPSIDGSLHTISDLKDPVSCISKHGKDCLENIFDRDDFYVSNITQEGSFDNIKINFKKPLDSKNAKIHFVVRKSEIVTFAWQYMLDGIGKNNWNFLNNLAKLPLFKNAWKNTLEDDWKANVYVLIGTDWEHIGSLEAGRHKRFNEFLIDVKDIEKIKSEDLEIKIEFTRGFWEIVSVKADFTNDKILSHGIIEPIQNDKTTKLLSKEDGKRKTMVTGDSFILEYKLPENVKDPQFFIKTNGYYNFNEFTEEVSVVDFWKTIKNVFLPFLFEKGFEGQFFIDKYHHTLYENSVSLDVTASSNTAPVVTVSTDLQSTLYTDTTASAYATPTDDDGDTLSVRAEWFVDFVNVFNETKSSISNGTATQFTLSGSTYFDRDESVQVKFTANDGTDDSTQVSSSLRTVQNTAPTTPTDLSASTGKKVGEAISATCSDSSDADSDAVTYFYEFYNNDDTTMLQSYSASNSYVLQVSDAHDELRIRCKANDGTLYSGEDTVTRTTADSLPTTPTSDSLTPNNPVITNTLTGSCSGSSDADGDSITYKYRFYSITDASERQAMSTDNTYPLSSPSDSHDNMRVDCLASTTYGDGSTRTGTDTEIVENTLPTTPTDLDVNSGAKVGETLTATCSDSSDADGDSITYFYEFYNNNDTTTVQSYSTDNTYVLQVSDAHDELRIRCKANDGTGYSGEDTVTRTTVNTVPVAGIDGNVTPSDPKVNENVTCNYGSYSDADGDSKSGTEYKWYNGTILLSTTTQSFNVSEENLKRGDVLTCSYRFYDGIEWSLWENATLTATITNDPPQINNMTILPETIYTNTTINWSFNVSDNDENNMNLTITYYVDDLIIGYDNRTNISDGSTILTSLNSSNYVKGNNVTLSVLAYDGYDYGDETNSSVIVSNSPPYATNIIIYPVDSVAGEDLTATYVYNDLDGDSESGTTYKWFRNSAIIGGETTKTLSSSNFDTGDYIIFQVILSDGIDVADEKNSTEKEILQAQTTATPGTNTDQEEDLCKINVFPKYLQITEKSFSPLFTIENMMEKTKLFDLRIEKAENHDDLIGTLKLEYDSFVIKKGDIFENKLTYKRPLLGNDDQETKMYLVIDQEGCEEVSVAIEIRLDAYNKLGLQLEKAINFMKEPLFSQLDWLKNAYVLLFFIMGSFAVMWYPLTNTKSFIEGVFKFGAVFVIAGIFFGITYLIKIAGGMLW